MTHDVALILKGEFKLESGVNKPWVSASERTNKLR